MKKLQSFADERLLDGCIYCGARANTRDHVPSRVFLEQPFPADLPVVPCCSNCNNNFSKDEEYLACVVECVIAGSTDPNQIQRPGIAKILRSRPAIALMIGRSRYSTDGQFGFSPNLNRVRTVLLKLVRGHAAFELGQTCREQPTDFWFSPLASLSEAEREEFNASRMIDLFGEVGSRMFQRLFVVSVGVEASNSGPAAIGVLVNDWVDVQDGRYRYFTSDDSDGIRVKLVIGEYLACEAFWPALD